RAMWLAHDPAALDTAQKVAKDSIVGPDAEILVGDLLRDKHDSGVAAYYKDYLARHPKGPFRSEARLDLAEASPPDEAMALHRLIAIEDPLTSWATKSEKQLKQMKGVPALTAAEHITQGMVLFDNMRNPESEKAFDDALADPKISAADKCVAAYHRAQS